MSDALGAVDHDARGAIAPSPELERTAESERSDTVWLGIGFGLFGSVLGGIAGASSVQGISQTLLTTVLTFVGGAFLSYAGFRVRTRSGEDLTVSGVRLGSSLAAISLGIWVGAAVGISARLGFDAREHSRVREEQRQAATSAEALPAPTPRALLQADQGASLCRETRQRLTDPGYARTSPEVMLRELRGVVEECCGR